MPVTYHKLREHGVQLIGGRHWQRGLDDLQREAAVRAQAVGDLRVTVVLEATEDEGEAARRTLARRHGDGNGDGVNSRLDPAFCQISWLRLGPPAKRRKKHTH